MSNYGIWQLLCIKLILPITHYLLLMKLAGMVEMVDTLDLGSRFWGFESLFPYEIASLFQLAEKTALNPV